jgi:DNA replication and repair protein RecF
LIVPARPAAELAIERIAIRDLRNLGRVELEPAARLNVIVGDNGQGKTSILEAIYLVATSRSFRTSKLGDLVRHGTSCASVRATVGERSAPPGAAGERSDEVDLPALHRNHSVAIQDGKRILRLDGDAPTSLGHYATRSPVVVFDPQQMTLSTGPASGRRTLLDRIALFHQPAIGHDSLRYRRALQARQALLGSDAGRAGRNVSEVAAFEALLAQHGAALTSARRLASGALATRARAAFGTIGSPGLELGLRYQPGGSEDAEQARHELEARRSIDARRHRTSFGPHLDELELELGGHAVRAVASQGQHRAITLALKIAELRCIADSRQLEPILLLDDVSSELDPSRGLALLSTLAGTRSQIFLTTTRRELIEGPALEAGARREFVVRAGQIVGAD